MFWRWSYASVLLVWVFWQGGCLCGHDLSWKSANMSKWYSEAEVCVYQKATLKIPLNETYTRVCGAKEAPHYPDKFGIGTGTMGRLSTKPCEPPFAGRRTHFEKELSGYPPERRANLSEVMLGLHGKNQSLVFMGDSITVQSFEAFKAEVVATNPYASVKRGITFVIASRPRPEADYVYARCYREAPNDCVVVQLPGKPIMLAYFVWYSERATWSDSRTYLLKLTPFYRGLLVVLNHGLWTYRKSHQIKQDHADAPDYRPTIADHFDFEYTKFLLLELRQLSANLSGSCSLHFVWRETSAGHFASRFGYLDEVFAAESEAERCSPARRHHAHLAHADDGTVLAFDTPHLLSVLRDQNLTDLVSFVPFYQATLPLHSEHIGRPAGVRALDCVHFCWLPTLWQPVWTAIAGIVNS